MYQWKNRVKYMLGRWTNYANETQFQFHWRQWTKLSMTCRNDENCVQVYIDIVVYFSPRRLFVW